MTDLPFETSQTSAVLIGWALAGVLFKKRSGLSFGRLFYGGRKRYGALTEIRGILRIEGLWAFDNIVAKDRRSYPKIGGAGLRLTADPIPERRGLSADFPMTPTLPAFPAISKARRYIS